MRELGRLRAASRRSSRGGLSVLEMIENFPNDFGLGEEGNDAKLASAGTEQWVGLVNPPDQIGPALSEGGTMFGSHLGLGFCIVVFC